MSSPPIISAGVWARHVLPSKNGKSDLIITVLHEGEEVKVGIIEREGHRPFVGTKDEILRALEGK